jgi:Flp pilus assembly protein TadD
MSAQEEHPATTDVAGSLEIAGRFEQRGQFAEALAVAEIALGREPAHLKALSLAGRCLLALRRPADAVAPLQKAAAAAPKDAKAHCQLGEALEAAERLSDARAAFAKATILSPELAWGWFGFGSVAFKQGEYGEGERAVTEGLTLRPAYPEMLMLRGFCRLGLGHDDAARADLREAKRLKPELTSRIHQTLNGRLML